MPLFIFKTKDEIRDDFLRVIRNGLARLQRFINIGPGTDEYIRGEAIGQFGSLVQANLQAAYDAVFADTAAGEDLDRLLRVYDLNRKQAGGSSGRITLQSGSSTLVPVGAQLSSPQGFIFRVTTGGTYSNGDTIPITCVDTGTQTNLPSGTVLKWANPPAYASNTAVLATATSEGVDQESDEGARLRLLSHLAHAPSGGNWSWWKELGEGTDPSVQSVFVYACANGPSTVYLAIVAAPSKFSKSRVIASDKLNSTIIPIILGEATVGIHAVVQTVTDVPTSVSFKLALPVSNAGWKDSAQFPQVDGDTFNHIEVTSVTSSSQFTVEAPTAPVAGVSRIAWIDLTDYTVKEATVSSFVAGGGNSYQLTLDAPFVGVSTGDWIMPAANNLQAYVDAVLAHFALMGPGEKTNQSAVLPMALRKPLPTELYTNRIDAAMLKSLISSSPEVQTADFYYRENISTPMPANITSNPYILIPHRLGFYS